MTAPQTRMHKGGDAMELTLSLTNTVCVDLCGAQ